MTAAMNVQWEGIEPKGEEGKGVGNGKDGREKKNEIGNGKEDGGLAAPRSVED